MNQPDRLATVEISYSILETFLDAMAKGVCLLVPRFRGLPADAKVVRVSDERRGQANVVVTVRSESLDVVPVGWPIPALSPTVSTTDEEWVKANDASEAIFRLEAENAFLRKLFADRVKESYVAALAAALEREACAKLVEAVGETGEYLEWGRGSIDMVAVAVPEIAARIRARCEG